MIDWQTAKCILTAILAVVVVVILVGGGTLLACIPDNDGESGCD